MPKKFPNTESNNEKQFLNSYISLFKECHKILCKTKKSYYNGAIIDLQRYQSYELLHNRFNDWTKQAIENFEQTWRQHNLENSIWESSKLTFFITTLEAFKYKFFSEISYEAASDGTIWNEIFKKKMNDTEWKNWVDRNTLQK